MPLVELHEKGCGQAAHGRSARLGGRGVNFEHLIETYELTAFASSIDPRLKDLNGEDAQMAPNG